MNLVRIPTVYLVFIESLLAIPIMYALNKTTMMKDQRWIFAVSVFTLVLIGVISFIFVKASPVKKESLFYVWSVFAFTSCVDLFIGLELDQYVSGFMEFYFREGEPYLQTAHGTLINWWDGTGHYALYLILIALCCAGQSYREVGLYWVGSIFNSMIVLMIGSMIGPTGLKWSYMLNIPYVFLPIYAAVQFLRDGSKSRGTTRQSKSGQPTWEKLVEVFFGLWFSAATVLAFFRGIAILGCKGAIFKTYLTDFEPYIKDDNEYGKMQVLTHLFYFIPFYLGAVCALIYPGQKWVGDWSIIHAGAAVQSQLSFIGGSIHWRTPEKFRVPNTSEAHLFFWLVNLSLLIVPHLHALYCHRNEVAHLFLKRATTTTSPSKSLPSRSEGPVATSPSKSIPSRSDGPVATSPSKSIPSRRDGPVTRHMRKVKAS
ncbi:hypothetical protein CHS0354_001181 [Potamilus streckersoni]|uniref:EXPERA domain-containing protein n=1 Tax=Potamilus streckersoni TaxID=2493646 RepID=A0AAE0W8U4_9BIVA|nr:hypothetical protein CHS0354_001181 [Potamilus streckersoni]